MHKRMAVAAAAALAACGGGGSWTDPTSGSFSSQDSAQVMGMISGAFTAVARQQPDPQLRNALTQTVNVTQACVASGSVSVNGSMDANCSPSGACSFNGSLSLHLNACSNGNGYVGDGYLNIGASGSTTSTTFSVQETIQGGITVTNNGTVIGTCGINVTASVSFDGTTETVHVSGTICKQPVSS